MSSVEEVAVLLNCVRDAERVDTVPSDTTDTDGDAGWMLSSDSRTVEPGPVEASLLAELSSDMLSDMLLDEFS